MTGTSWHRGLVSMLALAVCSWMGTAVAQTKIAVVDLRGAVMQTEDGLRAQKRLKNYTVNRQAELDRRQKALQSEQADLQLQARVLSSRAFSKRYEHWQRRMVDVQSKFMEYNKQLQQREQSMLKPIMAKMMRVIRLAASKRAVDIVVDRLAVPYARADLDLTDMVIQMYNGGDVAAEKEEPAGESGGDEPTEEKKGDDSP